MPTIRLSHLYRSSPSLVNILRTLWVAAILWFELGTFISSVSDCAWPDASLPLAGATTGSCVVAHDRPQELRRADVTHVLLIADAQIPDERSPCLSTRHELAEVLQVLA